MERIHRCGWRDTAHTLAGSIMIARGDDAHDGATMVPSDLILWESTRDAISVIQEDLTILDILQIGMIRLSIQVADSVVDDTDRNVLSWASVLEEFVRRLHPGTFEVPLTPGVPVAPTRWLAVLDDLGHGVEHLPGGEEFVGDIFQFFIKPERRFHVVQTRKPVPACSWTRLEAEHLIESGVDGPDRFDPICLREPSNLEPRHTHSRTQIGAPETQPGAFDADHAAQRFDRCRSVPRMGSDETCDRQIVRFAGREPQSLDPLPSLFIEPGREAIIFLTWVSTRLYSRQFRCFSDEIVDGDACSAARGRRIELQAEGARASIYPRNCEASEVGLHEDGHPFEWGSARHPTTEDPHSPLSQGNGE
ncbi:MAG: hypothetical protein R3F65_06570 [bacterium]